MLRTESQLTFYSGLACLPINTYRNADDMTDNPLKGTLTVTCENVPISALMIKTKITDPKANDLNQLEVVYTMNKYTAKTLRDYIDSYLESQE
jgi:hypothetical protein